MAQTSPAPLLLEVVRAEGLYMYTPEGKQVADLISGIGVSNIGHCHPQVVAAVQQQAARYMHLMVYGELVQPPQVALAQALVATLPAGLDNVYFTNSGTEAIEGAMKLAKRYTGRQEIISCVNAYHGSTQGSLSASGSEAFKRAYRPLLPQVRHVHYGSFSNLSHITSATAAVLIETVQGEAGVRVACANYFQQLRARCDEVGALLMLDEIQCGMGRSGKLWAFEHLGIVPDVLISAKGLGGGMPLGAFIANKAVMNVFTEHPVLGHLTTFGGHPVSCAAGLATLQVISEEKLLEAVEEKERLFRRLLKHPAIREIRSRGLLMALEFEDFATLKPIIDRALRRGVLTDWFLFCDNSMRIAPPLTITAAQIEAVCATLLDCIEA